MTGSIQRRPALGHGAAFITACIWASTFISIKGLLQAFSPVEIMVFRLVIAWLVLVAVRPRFFRVKNLQHEWLFMLAGLCGVTLYSIFQNVALTYTYAANASVLISVAPFFIAIFSFFFLKDERPGMQFFWFPNQFLPSSSASTSSSRSSEGSVSALSFFFGKIFLQNIFTKSPPASKIASKP